MDQYSPQAIRGYFKKNDSPLAKILKKVNELNEIESHFLPFLRESKPHIANGLKVIKYEQGKITVIVASGHIATHLRLFQSMLLADMQKHPTLSSIKEIIIKTRPFQYQTPVDTPVIPERKVITPSKEAVAIFETLANRLPDSPLKNILKKIAQR